MAQDIKTALQALQPEKVPVGWPWRLLLFMLIIFGITVAIYLGITMGYKPYLNLQIKNLDGQIANLSKNIDETQRKSLANFYSQLVNVQALLSSHPLGSKIFDFLEKNTHQQVYFLDAALSLSDKTLKLDGAASDYGVLIQQLELFRRDPGVEQIFLDDSHTSEGNVNFSLRIVFNQDLIKQ